MDDDGDEYLGNDLEFEGVAGEPAAVAGKARSANGKVTLENVKPGTYQLRTAGLHVTGSGRSFQVYADPVKVEVKPGEAAAVKVTLPGPFLIMLPVPLITPV